MLYELDSDQNSVIDIQDRLACGDALDTPFSVDKSADQTARIDDTARSGGSTQKDSHFLATSAKYDVASVIDGIFNSELMESPVRKDRGRMTASEFTKRSQNTRQTMH